MTGWDLDSNIESVGEIILDMLEGDNIKDEDEAVHDISLGDINDIKENINYDGENHRSIGFGTLPLCRLLSEHGTQNCIESGYVGDTGYVIPLHQIPIVPEHTMTRIGVCDTGSTKLGEEVNTQCYLNRPMTPSIVSGSITFSSILQQVHNSMHSNDILPPSFTTKAMVAAQTTTNTMDMALITLGCEDNVIIF